MRIVSTKVSEITGIKNIPFFECTEFGLANTLIPNSISFIDDIAFLDELNDNQNINVVFSTKRIAEKVSKKTVLICQDPRFVFYSLYNKINDDYYQKSPNQIDKSAILHPNSFVEDYNVKIGKRSVIGPNVTILSDVEIGDECIVQAGSVLGTEGFEFKRTSQGVLSVKHFGKVIIGNRVEIGANSTIDKGFTFRNTILGNDTKLDNHVHVAHAAQIGRGCFLTASSVVAGSCRIDDNVWLGPNSTISNQIVINEKASVSIGSVVTKNIKANRKVTGNFAIDHFKFLKNQAAKNR